MDAQAAEIATARDKLAREQRDLAAAQEVCTAGLPVLLRVRMLRTYLARGVDRC
jgi:hypothetical protein